MKITNVKVGRTINLGQGSFESLKFEIDSEVDQDRETLYEVVEKLHFEINKLFLLSGNVPTKRKAEFILGDPKHFTEAQIIWGKTTLDVQ